MKKSNKVCPDFSQVFNKQRKGRAKQSTEAMKLAAAKAIAELVEPEKLCAEYIIPSVLDPRVAKHVAMRVGEAAAASGAVRK